MVESVTSAKLQKICKRFGVADVYELDRLFLAHDQELIKKSQFDPSNHSLVNNQIKDTLLSLHLGDLPQEERKVLQGILWLWYHHATTVCIWGTRDLAQARRYCAIALTHLYPEHPNKITPMLCMLLRDDIEAARLWVAREVGEIERPYAEHLLEEYKKGTFKK